MQITYNEYDKVYYEANLLDFLPSNIIDIHTHVWTKACEKPVSKSTERIAGWISLVTQENSFEDLQQIYHTLLPGKQVDFLMFPNVSDAIDIEKANGYVLHKAQGTKSRALALVHPDYSAQDIEGFFKQGFLGIKVYLNYAPAEIANDDICIFDYLPHHQLDEVNRQKGIVMLHIPRSGRLKDPVNLQQMMEIEHTYPNVKLIIAHIGRAYAMEDLGDAMQVLKKSKNMLFDFSANTNGDVMAELIQTVGAGRILFGTDLPIFAMRAHRIVENGVYYNITPKGLYGDMSAEPNMRETDDAEKITFLMYEQINAFKWAAEKTGLAKQEMEDVFYNNAAKLLYGI